MELKRQGLASAEPWTRRRVKLPTAGQPVTAPGPGKAETEAETASLKENCPKGKAETLCVGRSKTPPVSPPLFVYKNVGPHQLLVGDIFVRSSQRQNFCFLFLPVSCSLLLETHLSSIYKMFSHRFDVMLQLCDKNTVASSIPRQEYCSIINSATRILWHRFFRFHVPCCWNAPIYHL